MAYQGSLSWPMARAMATRPNAEAIVDGETRLTYAQWGRRVRGRRTSDGYLAAFARVPPFDPHRSSISYF
jgi:non-ribosomal peptide synthetase component F